MALWNELGANLSPSIGLGYVGHTSCGPTCISTSSTQSVWHQDCHGVPFKSPTFISKPGPSCAELQSGDLELQASRGCSAISDC
jgi:hypothetical protein